MSVLYDIKNSMNKSTFGCKKQRPYLGFTSSNDDLLQRSPEFPYSRSVQQISGWKGEINKWFYIVLP